ncbi:hypothetical protein E7744_14955 (plasmid) [Citricoccus sp. SGAir0253]|uniref:hypothetical protein n=1 Tax=Citricoccus sp. SGAir0253 TaxID=2567881 RepID=UPI0010CD17A9|nr:hypothetical protein [Citricoccus sp. SGAir0253]QCU79615.1 hypothetical protein E7744_14955 [Citricoccus sp. SGAir0253]
MDEKASFDVESVPAFPLLTLWWDEDAGRTELNGVPVEVTPGQDVRQAAIGAVARQVGERALDAVRVRVLSATGEAWDMVVTASGGVYDTTAEESEPARPAAAQRRRWLLIGACALGGLALGGVGAAVAVSVAGDDATEQWVVPGADQQIPIALPEPFSPRAAWSVPVAEDSDVAVLDTGHVLSADPDGTLTARVPETGQPAWRGTGAPEDLTTAVYTDWAGTPSLVAHAGTELRVWDLRTPADGSTVPAASVRLEHSWRVEVRGARPLVDKGHWTVGLPAPGARLHDVVIPAGSRALTATAEGHVITASAATLHTVTVEGTVTAERPLAPPAGTTGAPDASWMLDAETALLGWDTDAGDTVMALVNLADATTLATAEVPHAPDQRQQPLVDPAGRAAAFDTLALTWGEKPVLRPLERFETATVDGTTAYGLADRTDPASLDLASLDSAPQPWSTYTDEDPAPDLVDDGAAYVVADTFESTVLYRSEPDSTPADPQEK